MGTLIMDINNKKYVGFLAPQKSQLMYLLRVVIILQKVGEAFPRLWRVLTI